MSTFEKAIYDWEKLNMDIERCTCNECSNVKDGKCPYAYDIYNIDGDCIVEK